MNVAFYAVIVDGVLHHTKRGNHAESGNNCLRPITKSATAWLCGG